MQSDSPGEDVFARRRRKSVAVIWGVLCHAAFVAAVALMIYVMYTGMQAAWGTLQGPWRWLANALLILQFPLLHSFLLSSPGRQWLQRLAPAGLGSALATTTYVAVASLQVILLFTLWSPGGVVWWRAEGVSNEKILVLADEVGNVTWLSEGVGENWKRGRTYFALEELAELKATGTVVGLTDAEIAGWIRP